MGFCKMIYFSALASSLIFLVLPSSSLAQNSARDYLAAHNAARRAVNVRPLVWNNAIASYAQKYANTHTRDCKPDPSGGPYGENIAWSSGDMSGAAAVNSWVGQKANYNYASNTCTDVNNFCGLYTQIVWRNTVRLGCGRVKCRNGGTVIVCSYDPPGNIIGQRPY